MNSIYKGETLSFWRLLEKNKIEIPIIQRDYAQGRVENTDIRRNFLIALKQSIENKAYLKLDFIYGNIDTNGQFQPLDGQQRLTTLFLLHWYALAKSDVNDISARSLLSKFSYETRISSREFCIALVKNPLTIANSDDKLSEKIIDSNWFFLSWKKDPTISSMLCTIDDIHELFFETEHLWEGLTEEELIEFYYVELENIGLTDDLYIKMNARGKLLSQFENFKAGLEKLIIDYDWEHGKRQTEKFSLKIDTEWTDYFWTNFKRYNSVDSAHMRFISAIAMYRTALDKFKIKADERSQIIAKLNDDTNFVKPHHFSKDAFIYLVKCYEIYCNLNEEKKNLELTFPLWRHQPNNSFLSEIVFENGHRTSYTLKVLFYAQTEYLMRVSNFKNSYFSDWMRVIRNIVSRGDVDKDGNRPDIIRSPQTFDGIITLISELAEGCNNIYDYLATSPSIKSTFAKEQIEEERIKAQLIRSEPNLKPLIWKLEDNELLRGRIEFVFYCIDFEKESGSINRGLMARVQDVFERYFNSETVPIDLRRAMLTIAVNGEYEFYNYWWSFWNVASATKRKLFANYREIEYFIYSEQREYFKKLVIELTQKDFSQIINEFQPPQSMPNWKVRLIKDKDLLNKKSNSNYIAIPDDNSCCYLLKSKRPRDMDGCIVIK